MNIELDVRLVISIIALVVSLISLGWNVSVHRKLKKKRLTIQSYKLSPSWVITIINPSSKPIYVRRIEFEEKIDGQIRKVNLKYDLYRQDFEKEPLKPEEWRTIVLKEGDELEFQETKGQYKLTRVKVFDSMNRQYSTSWFRQNNLK